MDHKMYLSPKPRPSRSAIQVDDDVHFVLEDNNFFPAATPIDKSFDVQRKISTKKIPVVFQSVSEPFGLLVHNSPLKDKLHSSIVPNSPSVPSNNKFVPRKRKNDDLDDSKCSISSKLQKKSATLSFKSSSSISSDKVPNQQKSPRVVRQETVKVKTESSSDSDIEIVAVKIAKFGSSSETKSLGHIAKKTQNAQTIFTSTYRKKSNCFPSEPIDKELLMNEADTAPFIPSNVSMFPDVGNRVNSMRWLSASGTIAVSDRKPKDLLPAKSETKTEESDDVLLLPEVKVEGQKRKIVRRELKGLYDNLNEISWAREQSFKNLLRNPRHSERATVKSKQEKQADPIQLPSLIDKVAVEEFKLEPTVSVSSQKKNRITRPNPRLKVKRTAKTKVSKAKEGKNKQGANKKAVTKGNAVQPIVESDDDDKIKYKLAPRILKSKAQSAKKTKIGLVKKKPVSEKSKVDTPKMNGVAKLKPDAAKVKSNVLKPKIEGDKREPTTIKLSPDSEKVKHSALKPQPNRPKTTPDPFELMPFSAPITIDDSPPSTSGTQSPISNAKTLKNGKVSAVKGFLKKFDNYGVSQEMKLMKALGGSSDLYSAVQKGSKLRVRLEPLEHTNLWSPEFYDEFRKHMLDQTLRKAFENRDHDSVSEMYQELLESFTSSQSNNSSSKVLKKKKSEEDSLRSSVRQSEGAFRYKEIVVKKHPNYMQVVLVPNMVKQNSLTNEALKELKDAFLLAKKDSNCRAVLLNSSGSYFCTGIDLSPLVGSNKKQAAEELSNSIRDLVITLGMFTKPVIAAVNGACLGFGVALLTYCDIVLASDKATFSLPATKIGYLPEGGITLTLPQVVGSAVASEMLIQGRRLTAEQALQCGLVSEVLWPTRLMNEVIPRLKNVISQPLTAMEATKTMVRCHLWDKLKSHAERERRLLCEHWQTAQCQNNIKSILQTGWLVE